MMHSWSANLSVHLAVKLTVVCVAAVLSRLLALGKHLREESLRSRELKDDRRLLTNFDAVIRTPVSYTSALWPWAGTCAELAGFRTAK